MSVRESPAVFVGRAMLGIHFTALLDKRTQIAPAHLSALCYHPLAFGLRFQVATLHDQLNPDIYRRDVLRVLAAGAGAAAATTTPVASTAQVPGRTPTSDSKTDLIGTVDHTGITVSSLSDALAFWEGVLGFRHLYTWNFEGSFIEQLVGVKGAAVKVAMMEGPGHCIELLEYIAPADKKIYRPRSCDVGSVHVAFFVRDIAEMVSRVTKAGWPPLSPIQTIESGDRAGLKLVYVRGPDGFTLEFLQRP